MSCRETGTKNFLSKSHVIRWECEIQNYLSRSSKFLRMRILVELWIILMEKPSNEERVGAPGSLVLGLLGSSPTGSKGLFHDMQDLEQNFYHDWTTFQIVCLFHPGKVCISPDEVAIATKSE